MIPPEANAAFVCAMEDILDVYTRSYDEEKPQVCLDEASRQLIAETRTSLPMMPGRPKKVDFEYERRGTANLFMINEPLVGRREVIVTDRRTKVDFAETIRHIVDDIYPKAAKIVLVMDNLNTHNAASLYDAFEPKMARRLINRLEIHHTPKHGSWLNMAEIELSVLTRQCLHRRIATQEELRSEVTNWQEQRNANAIGVDWRFTTAKARIKLKRLYPILTTSA